MHRELESLLHEADGTSGFVVAIFLDVRGFSSFARLAESSEAAVFLRRVYISILDDYFTDADFFKLTGDGMLVVLSYDEKTICDVVNRAVETSLRLVDDFPYLCVDDPMVNFDTPSALGVGLARGAATCLQSGQKVLDYSGRPLNLAARLMDVARPSGVVFDGTFGHGLLHEDLGPRFESDKIYVKGLAETDPMEIWYTADLTEIGPSHRQPIAVANWAVLSESMTMKQATERSRFLWKLDQRPVDVDGIEAIARHPKVLKGGKRHPNLWAITAFKAEFTDEAGVPHAVLDFEQLTNSLRVGGVKSTWPLRITVRYRV